MMCSCGVEEKDAAARGEVVPYFWLRSLAAALGSRQISWLGLVKILEEANAEESLR